MPVTDSMHIRSLSVVAIPPTDLKPLIDELNKRENHESVFVRDFSPENHMKRFRYIHLLEKGLPFPALLYTHRSIGNYHFVWKIPVNTNFDSILTVSQQTIERIKKDIPKYHHRCLRQELLQKCGRLVPGAKCFALREIYRLLTGMFNKVILNFIHSLHIPHTHTLCPIDDCSAPRTTHESEIDKRISEFMEMEDPDIIMDLREKNRSHSEKYKLFCEQCRIYLQDIAST